MGLSYNEQYNICSGIFMAFNNKSNKRILSVSHGKEKREIMKQIFPYKQYESWTKENFILACLYIMFTKSPSSLNSSYELLVDIEEKNIMKFKNEILYYKKYLIDDINRINIESFDVSLDYIISEYRLGKIKWYTFYFYILVNNEMEKINKSRINKHLMEKINKLLLYITFSEKSVLEIRKLMKENISIN